MNLTRDYIIENYLTKRGRLKPRIGIDKAVLYLAYHNVKKPVCKYCSNEAKFIAFNKGYRSTCCSKECLSLLNSETQKNNMTPKRKKAIEEYKQKSLKSEYWIAQEDYISFHIPIKHKCKFCGLEEFLAPKRVLYSRERKGSNCKVCAKKKYLNKEHSKYLNELKNSSIKTIPLEKIKGRDSKSLHKCVCGNCWEVKPYDILRGINCYKCSGGIHTDRFYRGKKTVLYYIKIENVWKIGITLYKENIQTSIKMRFGNIKYKLIYSKIFEDGSEAYLIEQEILQENLESKYVGEKILKSGNTELFCRDIKKNILSKFLL